MIAQLQLENYIVDELTFQTNTPYVTKDDTLLAPTVDVDFEIKPHGKDPNRFLVGMVVDLNKGQAPKKYSNYQIHLSLLGWFQFQEGVEEATKKKMIVANGTSILYGIARTVIAQLTGTLGNQRFILPTVNLLALAKQKEQKAQGQKVAVKA